MKADFIYPVDTAEWVSPTVVAPKKDGRWRVCVDFKPLNAATRKDPYPLPFIDQILDFVAGHEQYSIWCLLVEDFAIISCHALLYF